MQSYAIPPSPPVAASAHRFLLILTLAAVGSFGRGTGPSVAQTGALDQPDFFLSPVVDTLFRVGAGAADEHQLGRVTSVAFDASGHLHILDRQSYRLSVWNEQGELVRSVGRRGEGPAEFRRPRTAFVHRDGSVAVYDLAPNSFKVFDSEGQYLRSVKSSGPLLGGRAVRVGDGRWVGPDEPWMTSGSSDDESPALFAYTISAGAVESDTFFYPWRPKPPEDGKFRYLGPKWEFAGFSDGRVALVDSVAYKIRILSREGAVENVLERPVAPFPVTAKAREAESERQRNRVTVRTLDETMDDVAAQLGMRLKNFNPAQVIEGWQDDFDDLVFHEEIPAVNELAVDWEDRLWVARSDATGGNKGPTDIVTPAGEYLGTLRYEDLRPPRAFGPGGLMAYLETDELGVQTVLVVRLVSRGGPGN